MCVDITAWEKNLKWWKALSLSLCRHKKETYDLKNKSRGDLLSEGDKFENCL